jgi:hypothetical protein
MSFVAFPFSASLINTALTPPAPSMVLSADCTTINITDESNYLFTNLPGYGVTNFSSYRKLYVTHQSGKQWIMSSITGVGNQLITAASSQSNTFTYTIGFGDGVYSFNLISVPTWNSGVTYLNLYQLPYDVVYNPTDGLLYKNLMGSNVANLNNQPDISTADWAVITDANLPAPFSTTEQMSVFCAANNCWQNSLFNANCMIANGGCNDMTICGNQQFLNSIKVRNLIDGIIWSSAKGDFTSAVNFFNVIATICNC